ncbi:hypothetical protein CspeluHIS016_0502830 [Cutaneotrichosporon spelunceum]|uniref:Uncharacterized protein n=1 Tax=Cutaneotrichosporon spelunceum TaxID=1672016 RepID=A0AAD3YCN4_9TREE|nr:hypothetical protein CspeluHIS016_0502830 [Cutaneotrichosporon spelunceum]
MLHPDYTAGDAELHSADGVVFRVDRTRLSQASTALRTLSTPARLPAPATTLGPFLGAALGSNTFPFTPNLLAARDSLLLLQTYGCSTALRAAVTELKVRLMDGTACPLQVFVLAAHLRDLDLCRTAIVYGDVPQKTVPVLEDVFYDSDDEGSSDGPASPTVGTDAADVLAHLETIPHEYRAAMSAAWNSSTDPRDRGNSFIRHMCLSTN